MGGGPPITAALCLHRIWRPPNMHDARKSGILGAMAPVRLVRPGWRERVERWWTRWEYSLTGTPATPTWVLVALAIIGVVLVLVVIG